MFNLSKKDLRKLDYILLFSIVALVVYGLFVLNSAISPINKTITSQLVSTTFGFLSMMFVFTLDLEFITKLKWPIYLISIGLIVATIFFGYGGASWGANLWLKIGPINLQPSEISKALHIVFLASFIGENKKKVNTRSFILKYLVLGYFPVGLIIVQRDIGSALVLAFVVTIMFFASGISWKNIGILIGIGLLVAAITLPIAWANLDDYARQRIIDFSGSSERNLATSTHQTDRGLIALGSGQLTGRGYMNGPYSQNRYIPEQHTDFIFPVLVEDFGFVGGFAAIFLYFILFSRMIRVAKSSDEIYHSTMIVGVLSLLFIHIFENIGMTMGIMPVTGIPLPFFSNGGTFQLINLSLLGLCLSISAYRKSLEF